MPPVRLDTLVVEAGQLPPVSDRAAAVFAARRTEVALYVDRAFTGDPLFRALLGANTLLVMRNEHRALVEHLALVLHLRRYDVLPEMIVPAYRRTVNHGFDPGFFATGLEQMSRATFLLFDEELAIELVPVFDWIATHHEDWLALASDAPRTALIGDDTYAEPRERFSVALLDGDLPTAVTVANTISDPHVLFTEVVTPAMHEVGVAWEKGLATVATEHRATAIALRVLASHHSRTTAVPAYRGRAVVGTAPFEAHELGAWMLAAQLERDGWDVSYVGANVPLDDLVALIEEVKPVFVALSATTLRHVSSCVEVIAALRRSPAVGDTRVMLGGRVFQVHHRLVSHVEADACLSDLREAVQVARAWSVQ